MGALTVLGWALALFLVLALAALVLPACLSLDWRAGQLTVRARLLCFGFRLWPPLRARSDAFVPCVAVCNSVWKIFAVRLDMGIIFRVLAAQS